MGASRLISILALVISVISADPVFAIEKLALLIGNQNYNERVGVLRNPHKDIAIVSAKLRRLGFKVTEILDANYRVMETAVRQYISDLSAAGPGAISFFYYSGHGAANAATRINYLIPVDVESADDASLWINSIEQTDITDKLSRQAPNVTHYVVFDACRNELQLTKKQIRALSQDKGFVPLAQTAGLLVAYSTAPQQTASDAGDSSGPYAKVLAEEIVKPGVEAVNMFRNVQIRVKEEVGQDPWLIFPSLPRIYFAGPPTVESQKADLDRLIERIRIGRSNAPGIEAMKKICNEAVTVTASLASTLSENDYSSHEKRFWELYYGPMNLIEIRQATDGYFGDTRDITLSRIESAMVVFGRALRGQSLSAATLPHATLMSHSSDIEKECDSYLQGR